MADFMAELATPAGWKDPYPIYARLREFGESVTAPDGALIVTGYRSCSALLREPRPHRNPSGLVPQTLPARRLAALRPAAQAIARGLCNEVDGSFDFVKTIGHPFSIAVIAELLDLPVQDRAMFADLVDAWRKVSEPLGASAAPRDDAARVAIERHFYDLVATRRAHPQDDLLSSVLSASGDENAGGDDQLVVQLAMLTLAAGLECSTGLLANGLSALLAHPDAANRLRRTPKLARTAIRELLRFDSPLQLIHRRTAADAPIVGGVPLASGQPVIAILGAANRDATVFPSAADLILERDDGPPLFSSAGMHCLGPPLALLEAEVMLPMLLERFPRLQPDGESERLSGMVTRSYRRLPLTTG